jgi:hypothetical protein
MNLDVCDINDARELVSARSSSFIFSSQANWSSAHSPEPLDDVSVDHEQNTATRTQSQNLWQESLVQRRKALLLHHRCETRPRPVVLWRDTLDSRCVLDPRLDHIHGSVEDCAHRTTNCARREVRDHSLRLISFRRRWQQSLDLENTPKVTRVPQDVSPQRTLQTIVQRQRPLVLDDFHEAVCDAIVFARARRILQPDLDQLERHNDKTLRRARSRTREDREWLICFLHAEQVAVEDAPGVVGGELGGTLGCFHHDRGADAAVEARGSFVLDDLAEAVEHTGVVVLAGDGFGALELYAGLDDVEGVHDQDLWLNVVSAVLCGEMGYGVVEFWR